MSITDYLLIGVALSMDAFSVSICKGLCMKKLIVSQAIIVGLYFGIAQGLMPVIGYFLGVRFEDAIKAFDHWIAFVLLLIIGGKMLIDVIRGEDECECEAQLDEIIAETTAEYDEPLPGAHKRLNAALKIILIAYLASIAGSKANELFMEL